MTGKQEETADEVLLEIERITGDYGHQGDRKAD